MKFIRGSVMTLDARPNGVVDDVGCAKPSTGGGSPECKNYAKKKCWGSDFVVDLQTAQAYPTWVVRRWRKQDRTFWRNLVAKKQTAKQNETRTVETAVNEAHEMIAAQIAEQGGSQTPEQAEAEEQLVQINKVRSDRAANGKEKKMALVTKANPAETVGQIPKAILDGILAGHVAHAVEEVTIKAKTSPTKKDESRKFDAFYALDAEGMMILCNGKIEPATPTPATGKDERSDAEKAYGACDHFNYGRLLNVRQVERGRLEASIEGPEKQIAKLVKQMVDGGLHENEGEAREEVIARLKKKGQLAPDYVWSGDSAAA